MRIAFDRPPLFDEIDAQFHVGNKPIIFAWGYTIYNPQRVEIPEQLIVHETVHGGRQIGDIEGWWHQYIDDPKFRLAEEVLAHRAEYRWLSGTVQNRRQRRSCLKEIALRLASPLYGNLMTKARAVALICGPC